MASAAASEEAVKAAKVLMVGAGGIGCELLKTLALSGFSDIHIIDLDTIEVSNLNRQFLFRKSHVGQSKAHVARDAILKFRPNINIKSYHANVKDSEFNVDFFKQFNVVMNGLDNLDARRHVNRLCLAAEVPLVESGTTGFLGQVTVHVKGKTECYECQAKPVPKSYPVCTITSTPSKFVHCIVWAKDLLFAKLFGDKNQDNDLNVHSKDDSSSNSDVFKRDADEDLDQYARRIYDHVFGYNIEAALDNEETWKNRKRPHPIYIRDALPEEALKQNGSSGGCNKEHEEPSAMASLALTNPQEIWTLAENSRVFMEAFKLFFEKREKEIGSLIFDKDDQLAVEFVTTAANIRAYSFGIPLHSLFEAKGVAGNIVHAVATTNAIIAGLIVIEAIKVLRGDYKNYRMTFCLEHPTRKMLLMPVEPFEPNKSCYVCSETPLLLDVNTKETKLREVIDKIIKSKLGMNLPLVMIGSTLVFEDGDGLDEDEAANYALNLDKVLAELPAPVINGTKLTVEDFQQELSCSINIKHREEFDEEKEPDGMVLSGWSAPVEKQVNSNGENKSEASSSSAHGTDDTVEDISAKPGMKRKLDEISGDDRAAAAAAAAMPKHYRPAGKKKEGNAAKYITRTKAVSYLQISLAVFRKLCILKGVFPREPKKKVEGNHKTYYHMKDIAFLLHDPLIEKFREIKVHRKKVKKAFAKKNKDLADRLLNRPPSYKLDRLIIERYPTFIDALRDLDDCLTMVHLFAALPAVEGERVQVQRIHNCRRLSHEWQAYISRTNSLRKTFISVKGIYYQAEVQGQKITWLTPHALQQVLTDDVDFNVMLTFLEFYETLLGFTNFKLYHSINVNYPPILDPRLEALSAELYALSRYMSTGRLPGNPDSIGSIEDKEAENDKESSKTDESELRLAQLQHQLPANEPGALMHLVEESTADDTENSDAKDCRSLFRNLKFYLSREVPRESLLFIIPAFGGTVSWEGEGAPFDETDEDITHQIVDRPTQSHLFLSREYVQPQWIFDCVNARLILSSEDYTVGRVPPPHLSPFVDNDEEGYVPEYAETIKRLQDAAKNKVLPLPGLGDEAQENSVVEARSEYNEVAEKKRKLEMLEKQYHEELKLEIEGKTFSNVSNKKADIPDDVDENKSEEANAGDSAKQAADDAAEISKSLMSKKKRGLLEAMEIGKERKKSKVALLKDRKKKAESSASAKKRS